MTFLLNWKHLQQFSGTSRMIESGPKTCKGVKAKINYLSSWNSQNIKVSILGVAAL